MIRDIISWPIIYKMMTWKPNNWSYNLILTNFDLWTLKIIPQVLDDGLASEGAVDRW